MVDFSSNLVSEYIYHWRRKRGVGGGGQGGHVSPPHFFDRGGQWYVCATFNPTFLFST